MNHALRIARASLLVLLAGAVHVVTAQPPSTEEVRARVRAYRHANEHRILHELRALLALPNVAADTANITRNAALLQAMLERRGFTTRLLRAGQAPPAVFGERQVPGATRTMVFYAHYDGQPVDPDQWVDPPWTPTLRDGPLATGGRVVPWEALPDAVPGEFRLYGRSASDDKGPIVAFLAALDALQAAGIPPGVNLKVFLEGEEETGSPHLEEVLRAHADVLNGDVWIFGDGPVHQSGRALVSFGARGTVDLEMTIYGPVRALHSGHYGNWVPNPAAELAVLLAGMRDSEGRILIDGIADRVRPLTPIEQAALADLPDMDADLVHAFAVGRTERVRERLADALALPAFNVRGLHAGHVGQAAVNAIPTEAHASIDVRLVPDLTPGDVVTLVEAHVRRLGYAIVHERPDEDTRRRHPRLVRIGWGAGYPGHRTPMDLPVSRAVVRIVEDVAGEPIVRQPNLGGSLPLYLFSTVLDAPVVTLPIVNSDNNQHAANENLRLQNLWDGIEVYAALVARLETTWQDETR
jgi:acetylornithine deacetylase/succinyl-diaminopimelate desuccinylase-like protein